jgi:dTDP-4-dehydrorhamnose reductase
VRVLVTGAEGMLGVDLVRHLAARHEVTGVDLEVDVTDRGAVDRCVAELRPEAIIHCAAWTDVDGAEDREAEALAVNRDGAENVARAAASVGAALVYPSTDYVFDGAADRPYDEDATPAPINAYGRTKLAGERAVLRAHPAGARVARTAWLYGEHGRNFVDTIGALARERREVRVVADQVGCPTWTRELAPALEALLSCPPGVYHTAAAGATSWAGLARRVVDRLALDCRVVPVTSAEFARPAPRPAFSALAATRPGAPCLRAWEDALHDYLGGKT